jgi:putative endonuclease
MEGYKKTIGRFGENMAREFLIRRGYKIITTNARLGKKEIDIIGKNKNLIVFFEVKTRVAGNIGPAEDALKVSQIKTLKKAICAYCHEKRINNEAIRLDFIAVDINKAKKVVKIKHFQDIF